MWWSFLSEVSSKEPSQTAAEHDSTTKEKYNKVDKLFGWIITKLQ